MLGAAIEQEVGEYIDRYAGEVDGSGKRLVTRNGHLPGRELVTGVGPVPVRQPRVKDQRPGEKFTSKILPPYMRRSPKVSEVLPLLYLRGLSTGDFREALPALLGADASGLSPSAITRLIGQWETEYESFRHRDLSESEYVYIWVDGIHFRIRLEDDRLCTLVVMGVRRDGKKELVAVEDGYRESEESWGTVLRGLRDRGMSVPMLAIGDGALGFWKAVRNVWPETKTQRCWVHRLANILDKLPKRLQARAKRMLNEIMNAETRKDAKSEIDRFDEEFGAKYPKAVASLRRDEESLLSFYDFPAEHWQHIRSTNAIESSFATVRLRTRVTKGAGTRGRALTMAFKLLAMAEKRWRRVNKPELVTLVADRVKFVDGVQQSGGRKEAA